MMTVSTTASSRLKPNPTALTGLLFGVAVIAGVLLASAPRPDSAPAAIQQAFVENSGTVAIQAFVQTLAAAALLPFVAALAGLVRRSEGRYTPLAATTSGSGVLAAGFLMVQSLMTATLAAERISDSPALVSALNQFVFYTGGVGHVVWLGLFVGAASLAAHRSRALPRWLTTAGLVSAVVSILSLLSLLVAPAALFIPIGRFSALVVIAVMGVLMATRPMEPGTAKKSVAASLIGGIAIVILGAVLTVGV